MYVHMYVIDIYFVVILDILISSSGPVRNDKSSNDVFFIMIACAGVLIVVVISVASMCIVLMMCCGKKTDNRNNEVHNNVILQGVTEGNSTGEPFYDIIAKIGEVYPNPAQVDTSKFDHWDSHRTKPTPSSHGAHSDNQHVVYGPIRSAPNDKFDIESHTTKLFCSSQIPNSIKPTGEDEYGRINQPSTDGFPIVKENPTTKESCSSEAVNGFKSTGDEDDLISQQENLNCNASVNKVHDAQGPLAMRWNL